MPNTKAEEKTEIYELCSNITHRNLATKPSFSTAATAESRGRLRTYAEARKQSRQLLP